MAFKVFILLGLLFAVVLLKSSEVSARNHAVEASIDDKKVDTTEKAKEVDGRGGYNGGDGGYSRGGGGYTGDSGQHTGPSGGGGHHG